MTTLDDVRRKLEELRAADPTFKIFGAGSHEYRLHAPIAESEIAASLATLRA